MSSEQRPSSGQVEERHFVSFYSPGTFVSESTTLPIEAWDAKIATAMSADIRERYGARPYAFSFVTRLCAPPIDDGRGGKLDVKARDIAESGRYFLSGKLERLAEVEERNDPRENILRSNMACNGYWIVCVTTNGYKSTMPFDAPDFIVDADGNVVERGDDPKHVSYREACERRREEARHAG